MSETLKKYKKLIKNREHFSDRDMIFPRYSPLVDTDPEYGCGVNVKDMFNSIYDLLNRLEIADKTLEFLSHMPPKGSQFTWRAGEIGTPQQYCKEALEEIRK